MHSLFTVAGDVARLVPARPFADLYTEKRIQDWSDLNPAVINAGQPMISLGTEIPTRHGHYIDNLFIDGDGVLVAAEMKRGKTRRDVVSQMLDYAAFVSRLTWDEIDRLCRKRQNAELADLYLHTFRRSLRKGDKPAHRLVIVAESFEESTLDQALYLINDRTTPLVLIAFKYLEVDGQSMIYVEPVLGVIPTQGQVAATNRKSNPTTDMQRGCCPRLARSLARSARPKVGHSAAASTNSQSPSTQPSGLLRWAIVSSASIYTGGPLYRAGFFVDWTRPGGSRRCWRPDAPTGRSYFLRRNNARPPRSRISL